MNSSTKPPAGQTRKFNFDMDFEVEDERMRAEHIRRLESENIQEDQPAFVPAPTFSEQELQTACQDALQKGIQQGRDESRQTVEAVLVSVVDQAMAQLDILVTGEQARIALAQQIALNTTVATIKKIWPSILQQLGMPLIESTLRQAMEYNNDEPRIVVRVHDTLLDEVVRRLPQLQTQEAFAGKVIVLADSAVIAGDCKIEWADGGLERISRTLSQQLDNALERLLSTLNTSKNVDPERN